MHDILYTTVGSYGNAALVKTERPFAFQRHIAHIKPNEMKVIPEFLIGMLQSDFVKRQADDQARGVAQKTLNLLELKNFQLLLPIIEKQKEYVLIRRGIEQMKVAIRHSQQLENSLFAALQHKAFTPGDETLAQPDDELSIPTKPIPAPKIPRPTPPLQPCLTLDF